MPTSPIIIIGGTGGGGNRVHAEFNAPYNVVTGDVAENTGGGTVELHFTGNVSGFSVIPLAGLDSYQFQEAGTFAVYQ